MTRNPAEGEHRREQIQNLLSQGQNISVAEIAKRFKVNQMTIRRDLKVLEESGIALRCYGGAIAAERISFEFAFDERHRSHLDEKQRIGAAAAALVQPNQTIFLATGTTTLETAKALARRGIACTVITDNLTIASTLWTHRQIEIMLLGGILRRNSPHVSGPAAELLLQRLTADFAFLGSEGIDLKRGCFAMDMQDASLHAMMAANAREVIIVADASKLGLPGAVQYLKIEDMKKLITSQNANPKLIKALQSQGVQVTLV